MSPSKGGGLIVGRGLRQRSIISGIYFQIPGVSFFTTGVHNEVCYIFNQNNLDYG